MQKKCKRCLKMLDASNSIKMTVHTLMGKKQIIKNICYDCHYNKQNRKGFFWETATADQILVRLKKRFDKLVIKSENRNDCWGWKGFIRPDGYTRMSVGFHKKQRSLGGHVISWMIHNKIFKLIDFKKERFCILHSCDNRKCTNWRHLFIGNYQDNMIDMVKKSRRKTAKLTVLQVKNIKRLLNKGVAQTRLAKKYRVNRVTIYDIKYNRTWKHVKI